jgi:hypothetical protein
MQRVKSQKFSVHALIHTGSVTTVSAYVKLLCSKTVWIGRHTMPIMLDCNKFTSHRQYGEELTLLRVHGILVVDA